MNTTRTVGQIVASLPAAMMRMRSGILINAFDPDPNDILVEDIAYHLSNIARYGGASRYVVAQHVCLGADYLASLGEFSMAYEFLHHDDTEAILGDIVGPQKRTEAFEMYRMIEDHVGTIFAHRFGHAFPKSRVVDTIDKAMRVNEQRDIFGINPLDCSDGRIALELGAPIEIWSREQAEQEYLARHFRLYHSASRASLQEALHG
ncbi:hypothetical protein [Terriglobus albidus]|uniref:hypothetical protein n=1 Tax=Terriglobus albidus TaxID=1592106 RepID=UPI0021DFDF65|nr:hypothetical protein [Terriglobus albidus]